MLKLMCLSVTVGVLVASLISISNGVVWAQQLQLDVGTSTTQPSPQFLPNQPSVLPPPPPTLVRQLSRDTPPEETIDMPLSLMGQQMLDAVCDAQIEVSQALSLMPDLSRVHIQNACPNRLSPATSETI